MAACSSDAAVGWELSFPPLREDRCACSFPCDAEGRVDLDALDERMRRDYLYARAVMGREYARPLVRRAG